MKATRKAIVIEDDADIRLSLQQACELEGFHTFGAADGQEGLSFVRQHKDSLNLILLDLMMPGMNGEEFLQERERDEALAKIPVVVITASSARRKELPGRISGLVQKPIDLLYLSAILQQFK